MLLAAPKYNYGAICGIYFLSSIGLGGNIPIDATIALEFLPQKRRAMVSLLSMWQPVGVVVASGIAYGTAAKYRCDTTLPACNAVADGEACCTVSMNMGWRYEYIIIGAMTLAVFAARFFIFKFYESPKFLLSKGKEQEAIDVLHKIAKFNGQPAPTLTVEMFREIDRANGVDPDAEAGGSHAKNVVAGVIKSVGHLKGLFFNKLELFIFALLALAYMVSRRGSHRAKCKPAVLTQHASGRLLVLQPRGQFPPHRSPQEQRLHRPDHRHRHVPRVRLHLPARRHRRHPRPVLGPDAAPGPQVVPRPLRGPSGSLHGHVHPGQDHRGLRRSQRARVHHADGERAPYTPQIMWFCD
jgi:hypothetical protein